MKWIVAVKKREGGLFNGKCTFKICLFLFINRELTINVSSSVMRWIQPLIMNQFHLTVIFVVLGFPVLLLLPLMATSRFKNVVLNYHHLQRTPTKEWVPLLHSMSLKRSLKRGIFGKGSICTFGGWRRTLAGNARYFVGIHRLKIITSITFGFKLLWLNKCIN